MGFGETDEISSRRIFYTLTYTRMQVGITRHYRESDLHKSYHTWGGKPSEINRRFFLQNFQNYFYINYLNYTKSYSVLDLKLFSKTIHNKFMQIKCLNCWGNRKISIIGCGFVGAACAFAIMQSGLFSEMVLIDSDKAKAEGEALDINHGVPFAKPVKIYAGNFDDIKDSSIVVVTAGAHQNKNETRLDLVKKNIKIFKSIIPEIKKRNFKGILLIVSNPVDILTTVAQKLSGLPENRVLGSGTVLDTARLKYELGNLLNVDSRSVHAFIIGEHGDSEIVAWSGANISGISLQKFCEMRGLHDHEDEMKNIGESVKNSAYEIINKKRATYFGVAMSVKRICEAIVRDEKSILPVSSKMHGEFGIKNVHLSMPAIVGKDGVEQLVPIQMNENEILNLQKSAKILQDILAQNDI